MITCTATFIRRDAVRPKLQGTGTGRNAAAAFARAARQAGLYVRQGEHGGAWKVNTMPDHSGTEFDVWQVASAGIAENVVRCNTCCQSADQPWRDCCPASGLVAYGCIDQCHGRHLVPGTPSEQWHTRPTAAQYRKQCAERLRLLLA